MLADSHPLYNSAIGVDYEEIPAGLQPTCIPEETP